MLSMLMHVQNLVRFCPFVLEILSRNKMQKCSRNDGTTESRNHGRTGWIQYSPTFSKRGYKYENIHKAPTAQKKFKHQDIKQKEPLQKYRLGTISNTKLLAGLNRFYRYLTSPSASAASSSMFCENTRKSLNLQIWVWHISKYWFFPTFQVWG